MISPCIACFIFNVNRFLIIKKQLHPKNRTSSCNTRGTTYITGKPVTLSFIKSLLFNAHSTASPTYGRKIRFQLAAPKCYSQKLCYAVYTVPHSLQAKSYVTSLHHCLYFILFKVLIHYILYTNFCQVFGCIKKIKI